MFFMKELFISDSLEKIDQISGRLSANGIKHNRRTTSMSRRDIGRYGGAIPTPKKNQMHYIYVKRKDYDQAVAVMNKPLG